MKKAVSISLRFIALVALYMLIGWAFGLAGKSYTTLVTDTW